MGSNIGTTITAQMIAINVGVVAPVFAVVGVFMCLFFKSRKVRGIGSVMTGFGILFMGLEYDERGRCATSEGTGLY